MEVTWYTTGGVRGVHLVHQLLMAACATANAVATCYVFSTVDYARASSAAVTVALVVYQLLLSVFVVLVMLVATEAPLRWFPLLASFRGSGLYLLSLGVMTLYHLGNTFALVAGGLCVIVGLLFVVYGLVWRERGSKSYRALFAC
ncbi:hypothetical protein ACHHYP_00543 [Achlya hypogyna]|uniref:Uncharacterized protein n=1 Tax=Achlya hypogyna TaxID=1202772 RepID=A0A1V9ZV19_ACHHY|nr:hypothetical protein ACHHYP_00543 [Achlya hypogyna]